MKSISIENLRSLKQTGNIELRGLTVLLGENSCGKSSLLRSFPLIKQSIEEETTTPLLWYGKYVDFGSFDECVNKDSKKEIAFTFDFDRLRPNMYYRRALRNVVEKFIKMKCSVYIHKSKEAEEIRRLVYEINDNIIKIDFNSKGYIRELYINEVQYSELCKNFCAITDDKNSLIPVIVYRQDEFLYTNSYLNSVNSPFFHQLYFQIKGNVHPRTSPSTIRKIISTFTICRPEEGIRKLNTKSNILQSWKAYLNNPNLNEQEVNNMFNLYIGMQIPFIAALAAGEFTNYFENVNYIAPLRATAERYYRFQNLAIDKVDFQGRNLPMILSNMKKESRTIFSEWVEENFGFKVFVENSEGHTSIYVEKNKHKVNMADAGFGYSQILPIITQLWLMVKDNKEGCTKTLLIEQPELHLHPRMQVNLIDAFVKCIEIANNNGIKLQIILETHSETILNRIGHLIYKKRIMQNKVSIYLFNKINLNETEIHEGKFDEEGFLEDWPTGFFEPVEDN